MSMTDIAGMVKELGLFPAIAAFLVVYMTRTLSAKLDDVNNELRSERDARERNSEMITRELVTQTILLNQLAGHLPIAPPPTKLDATVTVMGATPITSVGNRGDSPSVTASRDGERLLAR